MAHPPVLDSQLVAAGVDSDRARRPRGAPATTRKLFKPPGPCLESDSHHRVADNGGKP
jgi:hypothetical protein